MREEVYYNKKYSKSIEFKNGSIIIKQDNSNKGKKLAFSDYYNLYNLIKGCLEMGKVLYIPKGYNKGYFLKTLGLRIAFFNDDKALSIDSKYDSTRDSTVNKYSLNDMEKELLILKIFNFLMNC